MKQQTQRHPTSRWLLSLLLLVLLAACGGAPIAQPPAPTATATVAVATPTVPAPTAAATATVASTPDPSVPTRTVSVPLVLKQDFSPEFEGARALQHAAAQMQWIPRHPGTPGWQATGDYIIAQAQAAGWQIEEQRFEYFGTPIRNIIAKRGSGPLIIVGAHYDSRRQADNDPDPANHSQPVPAANDGASGVAVQLELARVLQPEQFNRTVWLAFFDAEDNGGLDGWEWIVGSRYMAQNLSTRPVAVVVLDMIGDADLNVHYEQNSDVALRESIWAAAAQLGYNQFIPQVKHSMLDDHTSFLEQGIRAVDVIDFDYPPWHTVGDTLDKISAPSLEAIGRTMELWLESGGVPEQ